MTDLLEDKPAAVPRPGYSLTFDAGRTDSPMPIHPPGTFPFPDRMSIGPLTISVRRT